jgi:hypothetical protein
MNSGTGKTTKALEHLIHAILEQRKIERFYFISRGDARNALNLFMSIFRNYEIDSYDLQFFESQNQIAVRNSHHILIGIGFISDYHCNDMLLTHKLNGINAKIVIDPDAQISWAAYRTLQPLHVKILN